MAPMTRPDVINPLVCIQPGQDRRRTAAISRVGDTPAGSNANNVARGNKAAHSSTGVVSSITASHSKKFGLRAFGEGEVPI